MPTPAAALTWRLYQVHLDPGEPDALLRERAAAVLGIDPGLIRGFRIARKALDARRRGGRHRLRFVCSVDVVLDQAGPVRYLNKLQSSGRLKPAPAPGRLVLETRHPSLTTTGGRHVVVVGAGPAGLFAALVLALNDVRVSLIDRGPGLAERNRPVARFHRLRVPDPEANLLFGEGGAGTYSDGKIYTRVDDPLEVPLLEELVQCGAPPAIVYDAMAHIGTDKLHRILPRLRRRLTDLGVELHFKTRLESLLLDDGPPRRARAVRTSAGDIGCDAVLLAPGHSARDTWTALSAQGLVFEAKPFQLGLRIEHPQEMIDLARHGRSPAAAALGAASYNLICPAGDGLPAAFSFCMCPGGRIVATVNEPGLLCTNGMSDSRHSSGWATAALVTTFGPEHFGAGPFDGVAFQRRLEAAFFEAGGGDYTAPAQTAADFLAGRETAAPRHSTYVFGTRPGRLDLMLPDLARAALGRALRRFDRQVPGFAGAEGLFVGLESRSSGPVRMARDPERRLAQGFDNVYPAGEGAGWAGGIMSSALDGANSALALIRHGLPASS